MLVAPSGALAASFSDFESGYIVGATVNGQTDKNVPYGTHVYGSTWTVVDEWGNGRITDPAKPDFDERVVDDGSGNIVWRMSNAVSDSSYSDQPTTPSSPQVAGETGAGLWNDRGAVNTAPAGPFERATATTPYFNQGFRFKSATGAAQTGLVVRLSAAPRQSSTRVTWLELSDTGSGFDLTFIDVDSTGANFPSTVVATGLSYTDWHTVDVFIEFVDGVNPDDSGNDIVRIVVDGALVHTGTTWETYYRTLGPRLYAVDSVMYRISTASAGTAGNGFFFDDVVVDNQPYPVCGDGTAAARPLYVPGGLGEECDTGLANGTFGSCCSVSCAFEPDTLACSTATGACDVADSCTGDSDICPDAVELANTICRAATGDCDLAETCDGATKDCPTDVVEPDATTCSGASQGDICDDDGNDHCSGVDSSCVDAFQPSSVECRADAGDCDVAESCTGTDGACPVDAFEPITTFCTDDNACTTESCSAGTCTVAAPVDCDDANECTDDSCDSGLGCQYANNAAPCTDGNACTTESCSGGACTGAAPTNCDDSNVCTSDTCDTGLGCQYANVGGVCSDGNACTVGDTCASGTCTAGPPLDCDDGDPCTNGGCDPESGSCTVGATPATDCLDAGRSALMFNLGDGGKFRWNWEKGAATDCADFGNPALTTDYDVCVYDQVEPGQYELATSLHLPANPVWESRNSCDWIYLDKTQSIDGIRRFTLHPGSAGKSAIRLFANGANTPMPTPVAADRFFAMDPNVTVQLISSSGTCWQSEFSGAYRNNGTKFRSRRTP